MSLGSPLGGPPDLGGPAPDTVTTAGVIAEIEHRRTAKTGGIKSLLILGITLFLFVRLGWLGRTPKDIAIIVGVLLLHEAGHFAGMRLFGYRNVQMFFIPLFGAAVSGRNYGVAGYKRTLVTLMGPLPGIALALVLTAVVLVTRDESLASVANMLLLINGFNLLPFMPLDGGRLLQEVIFVRNRYLQAGFCVLGAAALLGGAYLLHFWVLGLLGVFLLISVPRVLKIAAVAGECRPLIPPELDNAAQPGDDAPAPEVTAQIIQKVRAAMPSLKTTTGVAIATEAVLERVRSHPPGILVSIGLLCVYFCALLLALMGAVVLYVATTNAAPT
jgi:Zn-dependent protease